MHQSVPNLPLKYAAVLGLAFRRSLSISAKGDVTRAMFNNRGRITSSNLETHSLTEREYYYGGSGCRSTSDRPTRDANRTAR